MIIKDVQLDSVNGKSILSAKCKVRKLGWDTIYFKVDNADQDYIAADASPFAAALLIPSMKQGEDLVIKGSISKKLYDGMQAVINEMKDWGIGVESIQIKADNLVADKQVPTQTAMFFSAGVDSFYTFLKHQKDKDPKNKVDTFILVNNSFDIDPRNTQLWEITLKNIRAVAKIENIKLVVVESNINSHELLSPIIAWDYIHGGCLAATGLFLRNKIRKIYVSSTHSEEEQIPWGSNLALDANWSTEKTSFVHDGSETTRLNKVVSQIADSPVALQHLRVCYMNVEGEYNCGKCDKCLRTMVNLYIAGALDKARTFPNELDLNLIATTPTIIGKDLQIFHNENLDALKKMNMNPELQAAISTSIELTKTLKPAQNKFKDKIIYWDHIYAKGQTYSVLSELFGKKFS